MARSGGAEVAGVGQAAGGSALYFVDTLSHRTLARCAACGGGLGGSGVGTPLEVVEPHTSMGQQPCVLGFRLAYAAAGEPRVRWAHSSRGCLRRLGLPAVSVENAASDIVFSRAVCETQRLTVLQILAPGWEGGDFGPCSPPPTPRLLVERWQYAAAASSHWTGRPAGASSANEAARRAECVVAVSQLVRSQLQADGLAAMRACGDAVPLCVICMQDLVAGEVVVRLPCAHVFHAACATEWLQRKPVCPLDMMPVLQRP